MLSEPSLFDGEEDREELNTWKNFSLGEPGTWLASPYTYCFRNIHSIRRDVKVNFAKDNHL